MKTEELRTELNRLESFLRGGHYSSEKIIQWVSHCVAFFASINVNESIISGFMDVFKKSKDNSSSFLLGGKLGPFESDHGDFRYTLNRNVFSATSLPAEMVYIKIAFRTAKNILDSKEEANRLVPKSLFLLFKEKPEYSHISSSLELLEKNFEDKDTAGISSNAITLLGSIFDLEPSLKGKKLSDQIRCLVGDAVLIAKFGITKEICFALDNARIIRNNIATHKHLPIEYDIPLAVALGGAYLVLITLQITLATGELIK